jgi:hypothetical protein
MTPDESLTRFEVRCIAVEEINKYDVGNSARHSENTRKMDRMLWWMMSTFAAVAGVLILTIIRLALGK